MARIRHINIQNFRCLKAFAWTPSSGLNCLIGPGDSGKSSVLEAIDLCLSPRRALQFSDADFHKLDVASPISISVTIGELDDVLKNFDVYGYFLRGFNADSGGIEDEPGSGLETVLTLELTVKGDLDPLWTLYSDRAVALGLSRYISWSDRVRLAPTRIGAMAEHNLAWRRGSVLNRLADEKPDTTAALASAAREARAAFGSVAQEQLGNTLEIVAKTADELGINVGPELKAMLDAHSVSFGGGTISLHDQAGVPLRGLGVGSTRLLSAGLQRKAASAAAIVLVDELEYGLEPHRIIRLLGSLGAKDAKPPLQAFVTTHSPIALRELSGDQLAVLRKNGEIHEASKVGVSNGIQGTIRAFPEAFLAPSVLVCEGASEVGLIRGLDQYVVQTGGKSIFACGVALVDAGGCDHIYKRVGAFESLAYRTAVLRDDDKEPDAATESAYVANGGELLKWRRGRALEDELFLCVPEDAVTQLLDRAIYLHGADLIESQLKSETSGKLGVADLIGDFGPETRALLGKIARKKNGWFKSVTMMEGVARDILGPSLEKSESGLIEVIRRAFTWALHV